MKKILSFLTLLLFAKLSFSQIVISGFLANPAGTDGNYEYVQLVASENIDFSVTPYTVVFLNNGTVTSDGWVEGNTISYGFVINSGTVNQGDVFYVGGSGKLIDGSSSTDISGLAWLRAINTASTAGDVFGNANSTGSLGNGGTADGIGVFAGALTTSDNTKNPIDCIFYGTSIGTAYVSATEGYPIANNDRYSISQGLFGEGTNTGFYFAPGSDQFMKFTGTYDAVNKTWTSSRSSSFVTLTSTSVAADIASGITITTPAPTIAVNTSGFTNDFGITYPGAPSSGSNFVFSATNLTDTLYISTGAPFEIRLGINSYSSNTIKIAPTSGTIGTTVLDVRFNPGTIGGFQDTIYFMSSGAVTQKVFVKGTASNNPELTFNSASVSVNENGGSIDIQVNIANANSNTTTCQLVVLTGSTGTAGADITFTSPQTLTFPSNSSDSVVVTLPIINDSIPEGTESIIFGLINLTNGAILGAIDTFTLTIFDNDYRKVNIADIKGVDTDGVLDSLNKLFEVTGVVYGKNVRNTTQTGFQFTVVDQTGGIAVFSPSATFGYSVTQGDSLTVRGSLAAFNGLAELSFLDTIIFHQSNQPVRAPKVVGTVDESTESELVKIDNVTAASGVWISGNQYVYLSNGDSVLVRIANNVNTLIGKTRPINNFSIIGIGGQFDSSNPYTSGYQLFPRDSADIIVTPDSLANFSLISPADNINITIQGASVQTLDATWETAVPAPGLAPASYTFLLDIPSGDFSSPVASFPSNAGGSATAVSVPYFQILALLNAQGLTVGQSLSLKWTVRATTGAYSKMATQPYNITFIRGVMNSTGETKANPLAVYPNPTAGNVTVEMPETINTVSVYNIAGKRVSHIKNVSSPGTTIATENLANGIYIISVETQSGTYTQRLTVKH